MLGLQLQRLWLSERGDGDVGRYLEFGLVFIVLMGWTEFSKVLIRTGSSIVLGFRDEGIYIVKCALIILLLHENLYFEKGDLEDYLWIAKRTDGLQMFQVVFGGGKIVPTAKELVLSHASLFSSPFFVDRSSYIGI